MSTLLGLLFASLLLLAFHGWGLAAAAFCYRGEKLSWTYTAALGIALFAFVGGLLNLAGLATSIALNVLLAAGLVAAAWTGLRRPHRGEAEDAAAAPVEHLPTALLALAAVFMAMTLLPGGLFNWHDDFYTYFPPPIRMLQTGSLVDPALHLVGASAVTPHALLSALPLAWFPPTYIPLFDQVVCFFLAGVLLDALGRRLGVAVRYRLAALLVYLVIHPQVMNLSAVYSTATMLAAVAYAATIAVPAQLQAAASVWVRRLLPPALLLATLAGLKVSNIAIVPLVAAALVAAWVPRLGVARSAIAAATLAAASAVFFAPWLMLTKHHYLPAVLDKITQAEPSTGEATSAAGATRPAEPERPSPWARHLSTRPLLWGANYRAYLAAVLAGLLAAIACLWGFLRPPPGNTRERDGALLIGAALGAAVFVAYFATVKFMPAEAPHWAVRYAIPWLLGIVPAALLFGYRAAKLPVLLTLSAGIVAGAFLVPQSDRLMLQAEQRSMFSLRAPPQLLAEVQHVLSPATRARVREAQRHVPAGAGMSAFAAGAFHLDFSRNPILIVDVQGMSALIGMSADPAETSAVLGRSLCRLRRDYVLFQHRGMTARGTEEWRRFYEALRALAPRGKLIVDEEQFFILRLPCET